MAPSGWPDNHVWTLRCPTSPEFVRRLFTMKGELPNLEPNWNVAPTQQAMVIRRHPDTAERRLNVLQWGLVPHFPRIRAY